MTDVPNQAIGEAMPELPVPPSNYVGSTAEETRRNFDIMVHDWKRSNQHERLEEAELIEWEEISSVRSRDHVARELIHFPVPYGHLTCLRSKIEILIEFASTAGADMCPHERLVLEGLCALRSDIVHMGG